MSDDAGNFRSAIHNEPIIAGGTTSGVMRTPFGNVRALGGPHLPPTLPPPPMVGGSFGNVYGQNNSFGYTPSPFLGGGGGYSGFGGGFGGFGGGFGGGYGGGGYGGGYGGYGVRLGMNHNDPEQRFIQMAENSSRPAFQSIESLVSAIGNIASMLDSTFFALTSSFRAILGVAANFGRLRTVFSQFWQTFAIFRGIKWIYRKMLYWLRISNLDPSSAVFKEAFAAAMSQQSGNPGPALPRKGGSPWPVLAFISFIFTAPYLIMKLIGTVAETALEETRNPEKWVKPIETSASYDFQARNPTELSFQTGQRILVAPKEIQNTHHLMNTGWGLATLDGRTSGLVPITYLKSPSQMRQQVNQIITDNNSIPPPPAEPKPELPGLGLNDFATAPQLIDCGGDFVNQIIPNLTDSSIGPAPAEET